MNTFTRLFFIALTVSVLGIKPVSADIASPATIINSPSNLLNITNFCSAGTYYIDPSSSANGRGTSASPFNDWSSTVFKSGGCYLQKAGTVYNKWIIVSVQGTSANPITLGAYGTGTAPIIQNSIVLQNAAYIIL